MKSHYLLLVALLDLFGGLLSAAEPHSVSQREMETAMRRGLALLDKAGPNWRKHKSCFSCHHQTLPMLAMVQASRVGTPLDEAWMQAQADFTHKYFEDHRDVMNAGDHVPGGSVTASYGLWALSLANRPADETTTAMVGYLLKIQGVVRLKDPDTGAARTAKDGRWMTSCNRPPLQTSQIGMTVLALIGMQRYATDEQRPQLSAARERAEQWLSQTPLQTQEDRIWRLWGIHQLDGDAGEKSLAATRANILAAQREDGGWPQADNLPSDAFSTGQTLFVLCQTGTPPRDPVLQRAARFLLSTQHADGSWLVETRIKPVQTYFDNGDPHGKHQFLSTAATAWATAGLAQLLTEKREGEAPAEPRGDFKIFDGQPTRLAAVQAADRSEDITLVKKSGTAYVIYNAAQAPASVKEAAKELQRVLEISTRAQLPIVSRPGEFMIVLGDTPETRRAGIDPGKLREESFEMKTLGRNLFIAGCDTKDGEFTTGGGSSDGTYYGVMEFLERSVGVRWLLPGDGGEDIPVQPTLTLAPMALQSAPDFPSRSMTMSFGAISNPWLRRQRITSSRQPILRSEFNHAWHRYGMPERLRGHPEYMALCKGQRTRIEDFRPEMQEMKFCTTNTGLLDLYATALLEEMAKTPAQPMWAIAPSDGGGWCECEKCTALDEPCEWPGNRMYGKQSKTPRVLTFYNEIARRVKAKQPDKLLGGYVYAAYTYPPAKPMVIESNLYLTLAVRAYYGFTLYRDDFAAEAPQVIAAWDGLLKGRMGWVDYSTYVGMDTPMGTPYPPGKAILKLLFPAIRKHEWQSVYWGSTYGVQGWGSLHNYLVAKLMWDADANVDVLAQEWLERAYGPGGPLMGRVYELLDEKLATYKRSNPKDFEYDAVPAQVRAIHLPLFPQIESLYRAALSKTQTDAQRQRLQMFGDNLVLLHWHLRKAGWIEKPNDSSFYRSDADFQTFIEQNSSRPSISKTKAKPDLFLSPQLNVIETKPASVDQ